MTGDSTAVATEAIDRVLASEMLAHRGVAPSPGSWPLVLWTPRYATTVSQSVLSEYLASFGFVVAFARRLDAPARLPLEIPTRTAKVAERDARVDDMLVALAALERLPNVNASAVAVVAWSYTGEMATWFEQREPRVALVAGLSTNLLSEWVYQHRDSTSSLRELDAAYAMLMESREGLTRPAALDRASASYFLEMPGVAHGSFNALEGYIPSLLGLDRVQRWSYSGAAGVRAYQASATVLRRLLQWHLVDRRRESMPRDRLLAGIPDGVVLIRP